MKPRQKIVHVQRTNTFKGLANSQTRCWVPVHWLEIIDAWRWRRYVRVFWGVRPRPNTTTTVAVHISAKHVKVLTYRIILIPVIVAIHDERKTTDRFGFTIRRRSAIQFKTISDTLTPREMIAVAVTRLGQADRSPLAHRITRFDRITRITFDWHLK